jgi:hypothetical protein
MNEKRDQNSNRKMIEVFPFYLLKGQTFMPAGGAFPSLDRAISGVEHHFRNNPNQDLIHRLWQESTELCFQVYQMQSDDPDSFLVLIHPDSQRRMTVLATYKILKAYMPDRSENTEDESKV